MARRGRVVRPAKNRPAGARHSTTVAGEVRIYQELIRLVAERVRLEREKQMEAQNGPEIEAKLRAIARYREDLLKRLGLQGGDSPASAEQEADENLKGQEALRG